MKKILILSIITLISLPVSAGYYQKYYGKVIVKVDESSVGKGEVSVSTTSEPAEFGSSMEAFNNTTLSSSSIREWDAPESDNHIYYLFEKSKFGYELDGWQITSGSATLNGNILTLEAKKGSSSSNPTTVTVVAKFKDRTTALLVSSDNLELGTAEIKNGTNAIGENITVKAAYLYHVPVDGDNYRNIFSKSVKFEGWFDENGNIQSKDLEYTFKITKITNLTARFSWSPFITQTDGYYFVRSAIGRSSKGYVNVISDYSPNFSLTDRNLSGCMETVYNDSYISDPACVLRIKGSNYANHSYFPSQKTVLKNVELIGQGISTKDLTGYAFEIRTCDQPGFYKLYYSTLLGASNLLNANNNNLQLSSDQTGKAGEIQRSFDFEPLDESHINEFYFAAQPAEEMKLEDGYWTSMYAAFPFQCWEDDGVEAYYVKSLWNEGADYGLEPVAVLEKIVDGKVPAYMPVLLKCKSTDPSQNRLLPLLDDVSNNYSDNLLKGSLQLNSQKVSKTTFDSNSMRVLSVVDGEVGFYLYEPGDANPTKELNANKAWLDISSLPAGAASRIRFKTSDTTFVEGVAVDPSNNPENAPIYNLQGIVVKNTVPGQIYIKNGKKFVAR